MGAVANPTTKLVDPTAQLERWLNHASVNELRNPGGEAVCADRSGRVLLLQETPPRVELIDPKALSVVASIDLVMEGRDEIARAWSDPCWSPRRSRRLSLSSARQIRGREAWSAAAHWRTAGGGRSKKGATGSLLSQSGFPTKLLAKTCADFSDLEIGPDGRLYLVSDKSSTIARLDDLPPGGGAAALLEAWRLDDLDGKPEGLAFTAQGRAAIRPDTRKPRRNLLLLEPAVAELRAVARA
jgi:hypothetical protein